MATRQRWIKWSLQMVALGLVVWGIVHTIRKSAVQLETQQRALTSQAQQWLTKAEQASDPDTAADYRDQAARLRKQAGNFWQADASGLLLAGLCYAVGMLPASWYWRRCLRALGQTAPTLVVLWAYFYGNLGKYFPGKAMVIVLRLAALERFGTKRVATSVTIFMETLTMMAVGGGVAAICLILLNLDWKLTALAIGLLAVTFLPTFPPWLRILLPRLQKGVDAETLSQWSGRITWRLIAVGWLNLAVTWLCFGLSLLVVLRSLSTAEFADVSSLRLFLSVMGACALAVVLGFVSLIPGGAGVREVVLSTVLTPVVGPTAALCSALWLRIVWLFTELGMVGLWGGLNLLFPQRNTDAPPELSSTEKAV